MKKSLIIIPAILISLSCYSQDWFSTHGQGDKIPGYILGMAGDTIEGFIQYDYPIIMQKRIYFFPSENDTDPIIYVPDKIWGFFLSGKKWISTTVIMETYKGQYKFKRFGIVESDNGPLMLLRIFNESDKLKKKVNSEEAEKELKNAPLKFPENSLDQLYIKKIEGEAELLLAKEFKKSFIPRMKSYVGDDTTLMQKIESKQYTIKNIFTIVSEYNTWSNTSLN